MRHRYQAIGGSPLLAHTIAQAEALAKRLELPVRVAMRFSAPRVEVVLADLSAEDRVCLAPLAPLSVHVYEAAARRALKELPHPPELSAVSPWAHEAALIRHWASAVRAALASAPHPCELILTAHSLPRVVIERGDPYQVEFETFAREVLAEAGASGVIAYQSQGASGGAWLGPTLAESIDAAAATGKRSVLVAPLGFLSEHVETLYDLDVEARAQAEAKGLAFSRLPAPGVADGLVTALENAVRRVIDSPRHLGQ